MTALQQQLFDLQDLKYRDFHAKLLPGIDKETIIGIRTPILRKFAKDFAAQEESAQFLHELPHHYYEENNLHMMLVANIKDFENCLKEIERFLPYIDNWATCDLPAPKCFAKNKEVLLEHIKEWIHSTHTYTIRYGMEMLMRFYLDEDFLAKQWDATIPYIEKHILPAWVHHKTIQKAVESYRITDERKCYLKTFR